MSLGTGRGCFEQLLQVSNSTPRVSLDYTGGGRFDVYEAILCTRRYKRFTDEYLGGSFLDEKV
jgi:hypothetical protein